MKSKGFGKIAVGYRSDKGADPVFSWCWNSFIAGGYLRAGDVTLAPAMELSRYWAAELLAYMFLEHTDADTLFMLDDDMVFEGELLGRMRDNEQNWEYGIVSGLTCSRKWPHVPVMICPGKRPGTYGNYAPDEEDITYEVGYVGLACTLIRRSTFELVKKDLPPTYIMFACGPRGQGEDQMFCEKARAAGVRVGLDAQAGVGHRITTTADYDRKSKMTKTRTFGNPGFDELLQKLNAEGEQDGS
jgi:hypothetical protein